MAYSELAERQIREYEVMHDVVKGWEPSGRFNCFIIRQSNSAIATMARVSELLVRIYNS